MLYLWISKFLHNSGTFLVDSVATENSYSHLTEESHQDEPCSLQSSSLSSQSFSSLDSSISLHSIHQCHIGEIHTPRVPVRPWQNKLCVFSFSVNLQSINAKKTPLWLFLRDTSRHYHLMCKLALPACLWKWYPHWQLPPRSQERQEQWSPWRCSYSFQRLIDWRPAWHIDKHRVCLTAIQTSMMIGTAYRSPSSDKFVWVRCMIRSDSSKLEIQ